MKVLDTFFLLTLIVKSNEKHINTLFIMSACSNMSKFYSVDSNLFSKLQQMVDEKHHSASSWSKVGFCYMYSSQDSNPRLLDINFSAHLNSCNCKLHFFFRLCPIRTVRMHQ